MFSLPHVPYPLDLSALEAMNPFMHVKFSLWPLWTTFSLRQAASVSPPDATLPLQIGCGYVFLCLFFPSTGDVIYNKTDGAGCQFYATCNQNCELDRFQGACPSSSPPVPSTHVPLSTLLPGCDNAIPPRQVSLPSPSTSL